MNRVGILTFHSANNFGALLQAVSLQKTIIERGNVECELIDYEPEFIRKDYSISPFKNMHPKVIIKSALRIPDKIKRNSKFQTFREENTVCSKQCLSEGDFKNICNSFDEIVVGSDQVWNYNLTEHDMHYFLPEIGASVKKVAYAASTGGADFSTQESNKMILSLQNFSDISVRESASKIALGQRLKEKYIEVVLDPVFLRSKNNWMQLAAKPVKKDYILFFKMGYSKTAEPALKFAKKLSEETGYELLMLWDQETWFTSVHSSSNKKLVHWLGSVEYRYWTCERFSGHFWGIHILGGQYNIAGHHLPLLFGDDSGPYRYEGWGIGGGISYGYHFLLGNRWSLEANIGIGYVRLHYDKFRCETCGEKTGTENRNYFGPTKAAVSLIFLIK